MHRIVYGLLNFPRDAVFAAADALGLAVMLSKFTDSGVKPVAATMPSAF